MAKVDKKLTKNKNLLQKGRKASNQKGLQSKIIKGSKTQKGKRIPFKLFYRYGTEINRSIERLGKFVLIALSNIRLPAKQIEAGRRAIKKFIRKGYKLAVRVYPFAPITKRPSDVRMGKGKGTKISDWIYPLKAGKVVYEISPKKKRIRFKRIALHRLTMLRALKLAQTKFSFPTKVKFLND
jgi:large subunit ribosomal protein L16